MESQMLSADDLLEQIARQMCPKAGTSSSGSEPCDQIVHVERLAARGARYGEPSPPLPAALQSALAEIGITQLYSHQSEALERVRQGEHVVVVTATSSGKTLCYNLPVLETILSDHSATALYMYPINALVNDQLKGLMRLNLSLGTEAAGIGRYTGALNSDQRRALRARQPNIILTNPEMVHLSFLLWHQNWEAFWQNLRFVVVDEVHTYRGVFGSNMAHLFRRVLRVAAHYGASPQFICCSATMANPGELAEGLTGKEFSVVSQDGAGSGPKRFVLWNPPLLAEAQEQNKRRSYAEESIDLMLHCLRANYNTIVFTRARSLTERMLRLAQSLTQGEQGEPPSVEEEGAPPPEVAEFQYLGESIASYRAGYLANEREEIENKLKTGELQCVITTNALELGVDIGDLDAAIIAAYPGTIMSTWQQAGRAGRRGRDALIFMVASQNPLDQYYVNHPQEFFSQPHELAVIDLENQPILLKHLLCAARELPIAPAEVARMSPAMQWTVSELRRRGMLTAAQEDADDLIYPQEERREIHFQISLRSAGHESYRIVDQENNEIGSIEPPNVFREAHPGAIYQHAGDDYRVVFLDRQTRTVRVRGESLPHYTRAFSTLNVEVGEPQISRTVDLGGLPFTISLGDLRIEETVRSYQELVLGSDELVRRVNLSYPLRMRLNTMGMWIQMPPQLGEQIVAPDGADTTDTYAEGLHAVQHLLTGVLPLLVMCDRRDVNGYYDIAPAEGAAPIVFVYDSYEGGIGLAEIAYQRVEALLRLARDTVLQCPCATGCPACIQWGACRLHNELLDKAAARLILGALVGDEALAGEPPALDAASLLGHRAAMARSGDKGLVAERQRELQLRAIEELDERTVRIGLRFNPAKEEKPVEKQYAPGERVTHVTYGAGRVVSSRIDGQRELVTVRFLRRGMVRELDVSKGMLQKVEASGH
ncbi:MAG: DEAD/DEAH box helicase [Anaerolineae bacterium]|nr:DEAD/DEAH box helicase [Anaerolineae bacterium]